MKGTPLAVEGRVSVCPKCGETMTKARGEHMTRYRCSSCGITRQHSNTTWWPTEAARRECQKCGRMMYIPSFARDAQTRTRCMPRCPKERVEWERTRPY